MYRRFYAAGALKNGALVQALSDALTVRGLTNLFDWTRMPALSPSDPRADRPEVDDISAMRERAINEIRACRDADIVVVVAPGGRGTHCEIGAALASRVPVLLWVRPGVNLNEPYPCVFHVHPLVTVFESNSVEEVADAVVKAIDPFVGKRHVAPETFAGETEGGG